MENQLTMIEKIKDVLIFKDDGLFEINKKYILYVGRFASFKRPDYIIQSLKQLDTNIELILLGDGPNKDKLELLVSDLELKSRVHFLGRVSNPYKYMKKADIFVLSSKDGEGFPNVLAEAMVCKTAVISTDCISGPREILSPKSDINMTLANKVEIAEFGILTPVGDINNYKTSMNILYNEIYLWLIYILPNPFFL